MIACFTIAASIFMAVSPVLAEPISSPSTLFGRQVSANIPTECLTGQCKPYYDAIGALYQNNCLSADCRCTTDVANKAKTCAQCIIDANVAGSFNRTAAQNDFDGKSKLPLHFSLVSCNPSFTSRVSENLRVKRPPHFRHLTIWWW
ncbi:hypothetical protein M413DRAFT_32073 [Hebeloma cylindrosporum]|uniref:Extracellular membrane protein CFEM domain-containing protein n=1 Tax=Hebeloma cylindrosporum TaxID=76867 RepID=A0A0C3BGT1_HEBCY|nr:hypothetical protein M413DRAFT_32073 [Hebeloma cylindrosporum h7]